MNRRTTVNAYSLLRIIAVALVVIGHSAYLSIHTVHGGVSWPLPIAVDPVYWSFPFKLNRFVAGWVYRFHMPLFFVLSGAVMSISGQRITSEGFRRFVSKKSKRLLLPFFAAGLLFMLPIKWLGGFYSKRGFEAAVGDQFSFEAAGDWGHLWFLVTLFLVVVIFYILYILTRRLIGDADIPLAMMMISFFISFGLTKYLPADGLMQQISKAVGYLAYFAFGYWFDANARVKIENSSNILKIAAGLVLGLFIACDAKTKMLQVPALTLVMWLYLFLACSWVCKSEQVQTCGVLSFLDRWSMSVYLYHDPLQYIVLKVFLTGGLLLSGVGCLEYLFLRTLGVIAASLVIGLLVNKFLGFLRLKAAVH